MANNDVYVSYAWKDESATDVRVVDKLDAAWEKRNHGKLQRDKRSVGYAASIQAYMDRLAAGAHVIVVLSDAYLKSEYCMYELLGIYENKNFRSRISPIVLTGTAIYKADDQIEYRKYWEGEFNALDKQIKSLNDVSNTGRWVDRLNGRKKCMDFIAELLSELCDMNSLTPDIHIDRDFAEVLDRIVLISSKGGAAPNRRNRQPDSQFRREIIAEVRNELAQCSALSEALQRVANGVSTDPGDLAETLCNAEYSVAVDGLLRPATINVLKSEGVDKPEASKTWGTAKAILTRLSQLAVLEECVTELEQKASSAGDLSFSITVTTPFGVEMVSSRYRQIVPRVNIDVGKPDPYGAEAILDPTLEVGWENDEELASLLREIWKVVFPEGKPFGQSAAEFKKLNAALKHRESNKTHHYYLPVSMELQSALRRPEFHKKLMANLPALTVIYFCATDGTATLSVDEYDFMTIFRDFFNIPSLTGKCPGRPLKFRNFPVTAPFPCRSAARGLPRCMCLTSARRGQCAPHWRRSGRCWCAVNRVRARAS